MPDAPADKEAALAEAIALLKRTLAILDRQKLGIDAAPHIDLALHLLARQHTDVISEDEALH